LLRRINNNPIIGASIPGRSPVRIHTKRIGAIRVDHSSNSRIALVFLRVLQLGDGSQISYPVGSKDVQRNRECLVVNQSRVNGEKSHQEYQITTTETHLDEL
jgi:hypothetical protein